MTIARKIKLYFYLIFNFSMKDRGNTILAMMTSLIYLAVFLIQTYIVYQINPSPFVGIDVNEFFFIIFATQFIFFLTTQYTIIDFSRKVLDSSIDIVLMRPIGLLYYKYFYDVNRPRVYLLGVYFFGMCISAFIAQIDLFVFLKTLLFVPFSAMCSNLFYSIVYGIAVFIRNADSIKKLAQAIVDLFERKPIDVFPSSLRGFLTYFFPVAIFTILIFEIVRGSDSIFFWIAIIVWTGILALINKIIWDTGFKNYESIG